MNLGTIMYLDQAYGGGQSGGSFYQTTPVTVLAGATSVTITDPHIEATSLIIPWADNGTNEYISPKTQTQTSGQCVLTFDALEYDTQISLVIFYGSGAGGGSAAIDDLVIALDKVWSSSKTNSELVKKLSYTDFNAVLGVRNLLEPKTLKATETSKGVVFTNNGDGTITLSDTATDTDTVSIAGNGTNKVYLPSGSFTFSTGTNLKHRVVGYDGTNWVQLGVNDSGAVTFNASNTYQYYLIQIGVVNGTTYTQTLYPMIKFAQDTDTTYQPYAMTNKQLTDAVNSLLADISASY